MRGRSRDAFALLCTMILLIITRLLYPLLLAMRLCVLLLVKRNILVKRSDDELLHDGDMGWKSMGSL